LDMVGDYKRNVKIIFHFPYNIVKEFHLQSNIFRVEECWSPQQSLWESASGTNKTIVEQNVLGNSLKKSEADIIIDDKKPFWVIDEKVVAPVVADSVLVPASGVQNGNFVSDVADENKFVNTVE